MDRKDDGTPYADFSNVEKLRHQLIPEEFPDGPLGSAINDDKPVEGKSTPWQKGQYRDSAFTFPNKDLHDDLPRQAPGAHPIHDEDSEKEQ
ncbi:hypothetical protein ACFSMW_00210 [Virgibacillus halophilus]|uniref:hypothetical protein n=1 Tax=Tigheibacillus halophilus TaxID=361280 RepID=UPI003631727A